MNEPHDAGRVRRVPVGISAEALIQQWARQDQAPHGAAMVVEAEIAARARGGIDWRHDHAVSVGLLARPRNLDVGAAEAGWLAAGLAAARALDTVVGGHHSVAWPDAVAVADTEVAVTANAALSAGRVDFVTLVVRTAPWPTKTERAALENALIAELRTAVPLLDRPADLAEMYCSRYALLNQPAQIDLLPHGTTRGVPTGISETGALIMTSPTGLEERLAVTAVRRVRPLTGSAE